MTANTPQTRKAKGRIASQTVRQMILDRFPDLEPEDVVVKPSGVTGEDLYMSPKARKQFPYCIEVKCQETLKIWAALEQTASHKNRTGHNGLLIFKRNKTDFYVCMPFNEFLKQHVG